MSETVQNSPRSQEEMVPGNHSGGPGVPVVGDSRLETMIHLGNKMIDICKRFQPDVMEHDFFGDRLFGDSLTTGVQDGGSKDT